MVLVVFIFRVKICKITGVDDASKKPKYVVVSIFFLILPTTDFFWTCLGGVFSFWNNSRDFSGLLISDITVNLSLSSWSAQMSNFWLLTWFCCVTLSLLEQIAVFSKRCASLRDSRQKRINGALTLRGCALNAVCTHCGVIECQNGTVEPRLRTPAQSHEHPVKTGIFYGPLTFCINGVWLYLWWKGVLHVGTKQQQQLYLFFSCRFSGDLPCLMYIFSLL